VKYENVAEKVAEIVLGCNMKEISDISVDQIALKLGLNSSYLSRKFKEDTNYLLSDFLTEEKLRRAVVLLHTRQDLSIANISEMLGICKCEQFRKKFKKKYYLRPGQFRKIHKGKKSGSC
jgi:two-component system, response regulator YesN